MRTGDFTKYARQLLTPMVEGGEAWCPRCHRLILPGQPWDVGHAVDLVRDPGQGHRRADVRRAVQDGTLRPECVGCNRSAGAALGNRMRGQRKPRAPRPKPRPTRPIPPPSMQW